MRNHSRPAARSAANHAEQRWPFALIVGAALACAQMPTFFTGLMLSEALLYFIESLLLWFVVATDWSRARLGRYAAYGLLIGVLAQGRASAAVLLLWVLPLAWARS